MPLLKILAEGIALTVGSVLTALILAALAWDIARRLHCRRQAWLIVIVAAVTAFLALGESEFVRMSAILGIAASAILYLQGTEERSENRHNGIQRHR